MPQNFLFRYRDHLILVAIALLWLWGFNFATQISAQGIIYPDSDSYRAASENLYVFFRGDNYRPILISAVYGIPYLFGFGDRDIYDFAVYINAFCWICSFLIFFEIAKSFLSRRVAMALTVVAMSFVGLTAYVFHFLSENLYLPVILLGFWFLVKYRINLRFWYLSSALALFVASMLIRPGAKFLAIAIALYFIREIFANRAKKAALIFYASIFLVLVQCAGLKFQSGNFTISYIDAVTLYNYLGSRAMQLKGEPAREFGYIYSLDLPRQKELAREDFIDQIESNFPNLVKAYFWNLSENATTGNVCIGDCRNLQQRGIFLKDAFFEISKWQNVVFSILGALLAVYFFVRWRGDTPFLLMAFFIVYSIGISAISHSQGDCFHVVTFPFALLLLARVIVSKPKVN